ncbi:hypothetical protein [Georgfuchsia toluolica]|uniref:hypothetical protein n=1 Tax=Georgfuchsia toluolica TaxID=424218 RepID=UPI001C737F43|nr:hypothetical protein [Georgfuchsia toluolica]
MASFAAVMKLVFVSWQDIALTENHIRQLHRNLLRYSEQDALPSARLSNLPGPAAMPSSYIFARWWRTTIFHSRAAARCLVQLEVNAAIPLITYFDSDAAQDLTSLSFAFISCRRL